MNHDKFPSMQMNQKSKHNNSGFKKWMQILAGEELFWSKNRTPNWNSATKKKTTAGNPAAERKSLCPAKKKPSPRGRGKAIATTNMSRQLQLRHFSLPLYSIQFLCKCIGTKYRNYNGRTFPRVAGDGWRVTGSGWRVAGGGLKIYMTIKYFNKILLLIMIYSYFSY